MIPFSEQQKRAINSRNKDVLVSASAGSGKTTVMIERIASLLEEGHEIGKMLVVTFTRAAAADMKEKLAQRLLRAQGAARQAVYSLPEADISTLHGWCQKIALTYFYTIGLSPEFEVLEEGESDLLLKRSIDSALLFEAEKPQEDFVSFCEVFGDSRQDYSLKGLIFQAFKAAAVLANPDWEYLDEDFCRKELAAELNEKREKLAQKIDALIAETELREFKRNSLAVRELYSFVYGGEKPQKVSGKIPPEFIDLNDRYKALKKAAEKLSKESDEIQNAKNGSNEFLAVLGRLIKKTSELYGAAKSAQSKLDFNDLERYAVRILEAAGDEIRQKYDFVFVDEYQDINPLQNQIISLLRRQSPPNYFFFVGDLKQSIYAFRGCDPSIFAALAQEFEKRENAEVIRLNANHRSQRGILAFANEVFSGVMTSEFGGVDYKDNGSFLLKDEGEGAKEIACTKENQEVFVHITPEQTHEQPKIYDITAHEPPAPGQAEEAARCIADILENYRITENGKVRPVLYRDIAVLTRSMSETAFALCLALKKMGIRTQMQAKKGDSAGDSPLVWFLKLINNGLDDEALINSMLGFFGGFNEGEALAIRQEFPREEYYYQCAQRFLLEGKDSALREKLKAFFDKVEYYGRLAASLSPSELLGKIVSESGYFNHAFALGSYEAEALDEFLCFAEEKGAASLSEFLSSEVEKHVKPKEQNADAVRIMTAHSSKGLEFPFVLILDAQKRFNLRDLNPPVLVKKNLAAIKNYDFENFKVTPSPAWLYVRRKNLKAQLEEELRLLYVAITRAKYRLDIFAGSEADCSDETDGDDGDDDEINHQEARCWLGWLEPFAAPYLKKPYSAALPAAAMPVWPKTPSGLIKKIEEYFDFNPPKSDAPCKTYVTALADSLKDFEDEQKIYHSAAQNDDRAMETGTLYHKAMELVDLEKMRDFDLQWDSLESEIKERVNKEDIKKAADCVSELIKGKTHLKEQPFMLKMKAFEAGYVGDAEILVQGVIDLLIMSGDECVILDYKTGNIYPSAKAQLDLYALACKRILGIEVTGKLIYSFKEGKLLPA